MDFKNNFLAIIPLLMLASACGGGLSSSGKETTTARTITGGTQNQGGTGAAASCTSALALAGSVGYTDSAQAVIARNCVSCHSSGGTKPDLSTYTAAKAAAAASLQAITGARMPPPTSGINMSTADKASFSAWVAGGNLQTGAATSPTTAGSVTATPGALVPAAAVPNPVAASGVAASACSPQVNASASTIVTGPATATQPAIAGAASTVSPAATSAAISAGTTAVTAAANTNGTAASSTTTAASSSTPTYTADVKALLVAHCTRCHSGGTPNLSTYSGAKGAAQSSLADILSGSMPKGAGKLSAADISLFQAWVIGGTKQ